MSSTTEEKHKKGVSIDDPLEPPQYACPVCEGEFATGEGCAKHLTETHHAGVKCSVCGAVLLTQQLVSVHESLTGHTFSVASGEVLGVSKADALNKLRIIGSKQITPSSSAAAATARIKPERKEASSRSSDEGTESDDSTLILPPNWEKRRDSKGETTMFVNTLLGKQER